jgi:hypothetical protein
MAFRYNATVRHMSRLQELASLSQKRLREVANSTGKKRIFFVLLFVGIFVGITELFKAYQMRSISDAIAVSVLWLILMPAFAYWWYKR